MFEHLAMLPKTNCHSYSVQTVLPFLPFLSLAWSEQEKGEIMAIRTSARNRLPGIITSVKRGEIMAQIDIRVGDNHIVSLISREAADELGLTEGDHVMAIVKATEVMVAKTNGAEESHAL